MVEKDSWGATYAGAPAAVRPEFGGVLQHPDGEGFSIHASAGQTIAIQARDCLLSGEWVTIDTPTVPEGDTIEYVDPEQELFPHRFYRVLLP